MNESMNESINQLKHLYSVTCRTWIRGTWYDM